MNQVSTERIYDDHAATWSRNERVLLSDFTARPVVLDELGDLRGAHVLDLGCGEGYVARLIAARGASSITGIDVSSEMIARAREAAVGITQCTLHFEVGDAPTLRELPRPSFDRAVAVFLFNYLTRAQTAEVMKLVRGRLVPGGSFVFTVPHPCFPYMRAPSEPFYFEAGEHSYVEGRDVLFEGRIWRRDGRAVPVRCVHKTFEDYFALLSAAGFDRMPKLRELAVQDEHIALDPTFFGPLRGYPLHVLFRVEVG